MSTSPFFDTLGAADKLRDAGIGDMQARAIVDSIRDAQSTGLAQLATKTDLADLKGRLDVLQWVVGIQSAVVLAIALRVFGMV